MGEYDVHDCVEAGLELILSVLLLPLLVPFFVIAGIGWCVLKLDRRLTALEAAKTMEGK